MNRALPASSASSGGTRVMDGSQSLHGLLQVGGSDLAKNEANATKQSNNAAQVLSIQRSVLPRIHARKAVRHAVPHAVREAFHNEARVMDGSQSLHGVLQAGGCCAAKNEANATKQSNNPAQVLSIQRSVLPRIHARKAVRHAVPHAVRLARVDSR